MRARTCKGPLQAARAACCPTYARYADPAPLEWLTGASAAGRPRTSEERSELRAWPWSRRSRRAVAWASAGTATQITTSGAVLNGRVVSTAGGLTSYYFEYGRDGQLQQTPEGSVEVAKGFAPRVSARVDGLEPGGPYSFRVCAEDSENPGDPFCSPFRTFSVDAAAGQDYAVGDFVSGRPVHGRRSQRPGRRQPGRRGHGERRPLGQRDRPRGLPRGQREPRDHRSPVPVGRRRVLLPRGQPDRSRPLRRLRLRPDSP